MPRLHARSRLYEFGIHYTFLTTYFVQFCTDASNPCAAGRFRCDDGSCVPSNWVCDGQPDCPLGEDERACLQSTCKGTAVKCMGGECIPPQWMCDGEVDCKDLSDESNRTCGMPIISNSSIGPQYS